MFLVPVPCHVKKNKHWLRWWSSRSRHAIAPIPLTPPYNFFPGSQWSPFVYAIRLSRPQRNSWKRSGDSNCCKKERDKNTSLSLSDSKQHAMTVGITSRVSIRPSRYPTALQSVVRICFFECPLPVAHPISRRRRIRLISVLQWLTYGVLSTHSIWTLKSSRVGNAIVFSLELKLLF